MGTWIAIGVLVLLGPRLLRWWVKRINQTNFLSIPIYPVAYVRAAPESIPSSILDGLAVVTAELAPLGFNLLGYIGSPLLPDKPPRFMAVLRHPGERAFATVGFALGELKGAVVDFETTFEDGGLVRTVNRRGRFTLVNLDNRRVEDPLVATIADQWHAHQGVVAGEHSRVPLDLDLTEVAGLRNANDLAEHEQGVRDGLYQSAADGRSFRFTPRGAALLSQRVLEAAPRLAKAPAPQGALAMPIPVDDLERKYQDLIYLVAQRPKRRGSSVFLLSLVAFGASALFFKHWAWLLWSIPFLLLHELGHYTTMRMYGHRDATIRFIPFFGAATLTTTQFRKLSHEMVVLLAGPLPGIAIGFLLFQLADFGHNPTMVGIGITLVTLNGLNLLPLHPLDGGRILHALITAGRPRLDFALRVIAGLAFAAAAIAFKDFTLGLLAVGGFLLLRSGLQRVRDENAIRNQPGFSPTLTPPERRWFIFNTLASKGGTDGHGWLRSVQELEVSLGHGQARWWINLPWLACYVACLGGLLVWSESVFSVRPKIGGKCPARTQAKTLACNPAGAYTVDWSRPDPRSMTRNPFKLLARNAYPFGGFVWCTGETGKVSELTERLREVRSADGFCPALPWEPLPPGTKTTRDNARWTMQVLTAGGAVRKGSRALARLDHLPDGVRRQKGFDPETLRLYRSSVDGTSADAGRLLAERLGRSPTESCQRLQILSAQEEDETSSGADEDDGHADDGHEPSKSAMGTARTRISVVMTTPAEFAQLASYLCEAGCQIAALPYGSMDPRLRMCF